METVKLQIDDADVNYVSAECNRSDNRQSLESRGS